MGYFHMPFVTLSQMPELFNSVSVFTIMSPTEMTIFVLKLDLWCLVIFGFPKVEAITQILAFLNVYTEINLPDFKFQPEASLAFALHTLLYHREVYRALGFFCGSPPLFVQPCLFSHIQLHSIWEVMVVRGCFVDSLKSWPNLCPFTEGDDLPLIPHLM